MKQIVEKARGLIEAGRFEESIALLKSAFGETSDDEFRFLTANEIVNAILGKRNSMNAVGAPHYGTEEYDDLYHYLRVLVASYESAPSSFQQKVDIKPLSTLLKTLSSHNPRIKEIEDALKEIENEFPSGRVTVARRGKWAEEFTRRFPVTDHCSFSNDDPAVIASAKELARGGGLLILLNTDGHKNELCILKGSRAVAQHAEKSKCFIATAVYGSPTALEVMTFRRFRDDVLAQYSLGRILISIYLRFSPKFAERVVRTSRVKAVVKHLFLNPLFYAVKFSLKVRSE